MKFVVKGKKNDEPHQYKFSMASKAAAIGEDAGIPAAIGTILMSQGKIEKKGVFPLEGGVSPPDFLNVMNNILKQEKI